jgi:alkylated DNA nucleotide flippase Atl1
LIEGIWLVITVPPNVGEDRDAIGAWMSESSERALVRWRQDAKLPVEWVVDGEPYNLTLLVRKIIELATGAPPRTDVWGANWYCTADGVVLHRLADQVDPAKGTFDWSLLHQILAAVPQGSWTTYGALAEVVGTSPQPLGNHLRDCPECPRAYRVLGVDGRPSPSFRRTDPSDTTSQESLLAEEGVTFENGAATRQSRLSANDLRRLLSDDDVPSETQRWR